MLENKYPNLKSRALRRRNNVLKALRKKRITEDVYSCVSSSEYYKHLNQYSKGKIHCSCPLCRAKTNNKHRRGNLTPNYNPTIKEIKNNNSMDEQYITYFNSDVGEDNE